MVQPVAVGNGQVGLVDAGHHDGMAAAVADEVAHLHLAEIVVAFPFGRMNAEHVEAQLDGKAVALACPVKIIAALVRVTVRAGRIGIAVGIVDVGRGLVPVFPRGEFFAEHVQPRLDIHFIGGVVGVAEVDPARLAVVGGLAEFIFHGCDLELRSLGNGLSDRLLSVGGGVELDLAQRHIATLLIYQRRQRVSIAHRLGGYLRKIRRGDHARNQGNQKGNGDQSFFHRIVPSKSDDLITTNK